MNRNKESEQEIIQLLKAIEKNPGKNEIKLDSEQAERLARIIKALLKQQLH